MIYAKSTQHREALAKNVFKLFTDQVGGNPYELVDRLHGKYTVDDFAYHDDMVYWGVMDYFKDVVIPHKVAVYVAGLELLNHKKFKGWDEDKDLFMDNLFMHDISKFSANEVFGYAMYNRETGVGKAGFEKAWHHHKMHNPHHPEYWLNPNKMGIPEPIAMEPIYVLEMLADWIGAGRTYGSSLEEWLPQNLNKFWFGGAITVVQRVLENLGINTWIHAGSRLHTDAGEILV